MSGEAPTLPMPGCTAECRCIYRHHVDRRERSLLSSYFAESTGQPERRK